MKLIAVTCIFSLWLVPMQCVKRALPVDKIRYVIDPAEYYQSDEPHTDIPPLEEHITEAPIIAPNPPDAAIQQYVNQQGGPYFPPNVPMQWNPFMQPPYGPMPYPYGFAPFQTEYGVLVPEVPPPPPLIPVSPSPVGDLIEILKDLVPRSIFFLLAKLSALIVSLFSIGAFGGLITTVICTFTPLCTISFLPALALRNSLKQNQTVSSNIERVGRAVQLFSSAIEKYDQLQQTAKKIQNSN